MANIIEKAFDASKNIVRTIFLGKPNLFTTSDLNRQIEAFKYQMNSIENRLGAESDMEISFSSTESRVSCSVTKGTYFRVNGLNIPLPNPSDVFGVDANYGTECYFYVWGNFARKTYTNDPTHEIAGAKFSDGTSMPAADQLILGDVHYAMTDDLGDITRGDNEFSFLIAKMNVPNISDKYIRLNYKKVGSSVMMDSDNTLEFIAQQEQDHEDDPLKVGDDFNTCMNKLISKDSVRKREISQLSNRFSPYLTNTAWKQNANGNISFEYRIYNGFLYLHVNSYDCTVVTSRVGTTIFASASFEAEDTTRLMLHFSKIGYGSRANNLEDKIFMPIGSCTLMGDISFGSESSDGHVIGYGEYGLSMTKGPSGIVSLSVNAHITAVTIYRTDGTKAVISGLVDALSVRGSKFHLNPTSAIIPLME